MRTVPNFAGEAGATSGVHAGLFIARNDRAFYLLYARGTWFSFSHGLHVDQTRTNSVF